jgi:hypothetical protein
MERNDYIDSEHLVQLIKQAELSGYLKAISLVKKQEEIINTRLNISNNSLSEMLYDKRNEVLKGAL